MKKKLSEVGRQFEEIFENYHNPESRDKRKILKNRERRASNLKEDVGL